MSTSEYNTLLQVVATISDSVENIRLENKETFTRLQRENKAMFDTLLGAFSGPFEALETDFQKTKSNHSKRLKVLEKRLTA